MKKSSGPKRQFVILAGLKTYWCVLGGSHSNSGGKGVYICSPWDLDTRQGYKWGWGGHVGIMFLRQLWWRALLDMGHLMDIGTPLQPK